MEDLTFGVEIEFALALLHKGRKNPNPNDSRSPYGILIGEGSDYGFMDQMMGPDAQDAKEAQQHIIGTLARVEIPAISEWSLHSTQSNPDECVIGTDPTIEPPPGKYAWVKIKIRSPAFYYTDTALNQVHKMCELLCKAYRIAVTRTCGLHVHTFEHQLNKIHPEERRGEANKYCCGIRSSSQIAYDLEERHGYGTKRLSYNILNLRGGWEQSNRTIEFRQHENTFNSQAVVMWIKSCAGLVYSAREA
ncbi:hypothetical protein G7Y89_g5671 [Cudoniella acicularis]|uniref:Uncharacterized protein n=1 Tax=Cudoniella acicularis TaxID=354080 RepID=A0A8H4RM24_9HELO|nr:hypothetical protein G7Y89_g5671 [Cudoniella acicularis]